MHTYLKLGIALMGLAPAGVRAQEVESTAPPPEWVLQGHVPAGMTLAYLYNYSGYTVFATSRTFKVDGIKVAKLARKTWSAIVLAPGPHTIGIPNFKPVQVEARAGEQLHVMYAYSPEESLVFPMAGKPWVFEAIPDSTAEQVRRESTWVAPLVPLPEPPPTDSSLSPGAAHGVQP